MSENGKEAEMLSLILSKNDNSHPFTHNDDDNFKILIDDLDSCFEKLRRLAIRALSTSQNEDSTDEQLQKALNNASSLQNFLFVLKRFQIEIDGWKESHSQSLNSGKDPISRLSILIQQLPVSDGIRSSKASENLKLPPPPDSLPISESIIPRRPDAGFYREMNGAEIKNLCFAGYLDKGKNKSETFEFNHKIPKVEVDKFVEFFIRIRETGGPDQNQEAFVKFSVFSFICDSLLKFSKQNDGQLTNSIRKDWVKKLGSEKEKRKLGISFADELSAWTSDDLLDLYPLFYTYQSRDVLDFCLHDEVKLVSKGNRGYYKASFDLNFDSFNVALNRLPQLPG